MSQDKYKVVDEALGKMDLRAKVGQVFTQSFYGSQVTPDVVRTLKELHAGGLRITQFYRGFRRYARPGEKQQAFEQLSPADMPANIIDDRKDTLCRPPYLSIEDYAKLINQLKEVANERAYNSPLHTVIDFEGGGWGDIPRGGMRYFPNPWGVARTGDTQLMYEVCKANAMQMAAVGINAVHSPVLDVVMHPDATYIGTRGFGMGTEFCCQMAEAAVKGYRDGGVMCCGKHYPGRGSTDVDDHHDVSALERTKEELWETELVPYQRAIEAGMPMIMVGHSIYPAYDKVDLASASEAVCKGLTRDELGFKGMLTTDSMIMGAVEKQYGIPEGCVKAVKAGCNLILMKECGPIRERAYNLVLEAVQNGEITESYLDELIRITLQWKVDYGLYDNNYIVDAAAAKPLIHSDEMKAIELKAAETAVHVVRDEENVLPLSPDTRILLVEQVALGHLYTNDKYCYPGVFWDKIRQHSDNVSLLEIEHDPTDEDKEKILTYAEFYDIIIMTHYSGRNNVSTRQLVDQIKAAYPEKKIVIVANSPLPYNTPVEWPNVVCSHSCMPVGLDVTARLLFGKFTPQKPANPQPWDK